MSQINRIYVRTRTSRTLKPHEDQCASDSGTSSSFPPKQQHLAERPLSCQALVEGAGELQPRSCVLGTRLAGFMFCFCWQNSLLKLQALESGLCSAFLTTQEEDGQVHGAKDPAPASTQSVPADSVDPAGKRQSLGMSRVVLRRQLSLPPPGLLAEMMQHQSPSPGAAERGREDLGLACEEADFILNGSQLKASVTTSCHLLCKEE